MSIIDLNVVKNLWQKTVSSDFKLKVSFYLSFNSISKLKSLNNIVCVVILIANGDKIKEKNEKNTHIKENTHIYTVLKCLYPRD